MPMGVNGTLFGLVPKGSDAEARPAQRNGQNEDALQSPDETRSTAMGDHQQSASDEHPKKLTTVEVRQATGPRDNFSVLIVSMLLAAVAGVAILAYFLA